MSSGPVAGAGAEAAPSTAITIANGTRDQEASRPKEIAPPPGGAPPRRSLFARLFRRDQIRKTPAGWKRSLAVFDFLLRLVSAASFVAAAVAMGTADETLPFFTNQYQFYANFADLPALVFLVVADAIAAGYLLLSIPFSIISIIRPVATCPRLCLHMFDIVALALTTAAGAAAAAIIYLAHEGNSKANWIAICNRFKGFCQQASSAVVASFAGTVILMLMIAMAALSLRKRT